MAGEIDIVVTSFARAEDEHGMLRQLLAHLTDGGRLPAGTIQDALAAGWVGDVQFRPYGSEGPIVGGSLARAVTLFELEDLVEAILGKCVEVINIMGQVFCTDGRISTVQSADDNVAFGFERPSAQFQKLQLLFEREMIQFLLRNN